LLALSHARMDDGSAFEIKNWNNLHHRALIESFIPSHRIYQLTIAREAP
jgi:hypothetical protein